MRTCMPDGETTPPLLASIRELVFDLFCNYFVRNGYLIDSTLATPGTLNMERDLSITGE